VQTLMEIFLIGVSKQKNLQKLNGQLLLNFLLRRVLESQM